MSRPNAEELFAVRLTPGAIVLPRELLARCAVRSDTWGSRGISTELPLGVGAHAARGQ